MQKVRPRRKPPRRKPQAASRAPRRRLRLDVLLGLFASGTGDLGRRHDDYLYGWKKPEK